MKNFLKKIFNSSSSIYKYLSFIYNIKDKYWQPLHYDNLNSVLSLYAQHQKEVEFIQIGSNDGISNDPLNYFINHHSWKGICIEPVPENFKNLSKTYSDNKNVKLLNVAFGKEGFQKIYYINKEKADKLNINLPEWYSQLASFDKDLVVCDIAGENKIEIVDEITIESLSFQILFEREKLDKIDLLHIDTEGADWIILSSFPMTTYRPDIILFEHNHLILSDYKEAVIFLEKNDYRLLKVGTDTFCYNKDLSSLFKIISKETYRIIKTKV